ncbi:MAG: hypothetical protein NZ651_05725 [Candidatus Bipolaricaulota bacterium]|nr:hypothetical protein [Candidatus Bipolaricaulota bacterium]MDW8127252.1 hypothetical protein [Candidatus Bipolaricaulota bacterium]
MIFLTTKEEIRRGIAQSELRLNLLRICARAPRTIHNLIHAPIYPGIKISLFSVQSEINVSVELGELKNRMLLVRVGKVPDPLVPGGTTELLRTSLLAFLLSPELCWAEPAAYELYLRTWLSHDSAEDREMFALFLTFPKLLGKAFYVAQPGPEPPGEMPSDLPESEKIRIFGAYHIGDLPSKPEPLKVSELLRALRSPALSRGWRLLREEGIAHRLGLLGWLWTRRLRLIPDPPESYPIGPLSGPELLADRLKPNLLFRRGKEKDEGEKARGDSA